MVVRDDFTVEHAYLAGLPWELNFNSQAYPIPKGYLCEFPEDSHPISILMGIPIPTATLNYLSKQDKPNSQI